MKTQNWSLLKSLMSKATMKITFLLGSKIHKWKLTSRILSFQRKHPIKLFKKSKSSLYDAIRDIDDQFEEQEGPSTHCIQRTKSNIARNNDDDEKDIDQRAELFIANFRRQLRLERQISLELRYCK
ncbi:hypothetical protein R3W88_022142 [Solanum pinnatisectum]|uniref:Cotton fiber protein n=1 Tax=Solanum pinnatisectum TaxID=50273 RepID=A0AAV9LX78_9SOLN|nr:hypothetical protein R3W88_022142 [Solanum pinnatisectum]